MISISLDHHLELGNILHAILCLRIVESVLSGNTDDRKELRLGATKFSNEYEETIKDVYPMLRKSACKAALILPLDWMSQAFKRNRTRDYARAMNLSHRKVTPS